MILLKEVYYSGYVNDGRTENRPRTLCARSILLQVTPYYIPKCTELSLRTYNKVDKTELSRV